MWAALEAEKARKWISLRASRRTKSLILAPKTPSKLLTSQTVAINLCWFKPLPLWQFVRAATENKCAAQWVRGKKMNGWRRLLRHSKVMGELCWPWHTDTAHPAAASRLRAQLLSLFLGLYVLSCFPSCLHLPASLTLHSAYFLVQLVWSLCIM